MTSLDLRCSSVGPDVAPSRRATWPGPAAEAALCLAAGCTQAALQPGLTLISDCRNCDQGHTDAVNRKYTSLSNIPLLCADVQMFVKLFYLSKLLP